MFAGTAKLSGRLHALLAALLIVVVCGRKIRLQERDLAGVFGEEYAACRRTTWALIPGIF